MLTILLHSSKTMRSVPNEPTSYQAPQLLQKSIELSDYLTRLSSKQLVQSMKLSNDMATKTAMRFRYWNSNPTMQRPAIDAFLGDIYSGLQVSSFTTADRTYANEHLFILSGLYGVLRALDGIMPYRLEMGYQLPDEPYKNLYAFWGEDIAKCLPISTVVVNVSAVEYTKAVLPYLNDTKIVTPKFLTVSNKTGKPTFVTVHAKIARGAFAHWLITERIDTIEKLHDFTALGYSYDSALSTPDEPVFVCTNFQGLGLSVRLT